MRFWYVFVDISAMLDLRKLCLLPDAVAEMWNDEKLFDRQVRQGIPMTCRLILSKSREP